MKNEEKKDRHRDIYLLTMNCYSDLFVFYIKQSIRKNISTISTTDKEVDDIKKGGKLLWKKYYKKTEEGEELSSVVERLKKDLVLFSPESLFLRAYGKKYGYPMLNVLEKTTF